MSWFTRRGLLLLGVGAAVGVTAGVLWPGDVTDGESMSGSHWLAIGGFVLSVVLLVTGAVAIFLSMVGNAWAVEDFSPTEYLERMRRKR